MLLLVLVPCIGMQLNGARQWFNLGFAHLQPSEVGKLVFALWGAHVLALRERVPDHARPCSSRCCRCSASCPCC